MAGPTVTEQLYSGLSERLVTVTEVAEIMRLSTQTINRATRLRKFPQPIIVCSSRRWRGADIIDYLNGKWTDSDKPT